jgi:hypothetical protein
VLDGTGILIVSAIFVLLPAKKFYNAFMRYLIVSIRCQSVGGPLSHPHTPGQYTGTYAHFQEVKRPCVAFTKAAL